MNWVGMFQVGIFRGDFPGGSLMGGNFPGGNFPCEEFSKNRKNDFKLQEMITKKLYCAVDFLQYNLLKIALEELYL